MAASTDSRSVAPTPSPGESDVDDVLKSWLPEIAGSDPAALHRLAAGPPRRLGELLTDARPGRAPAVTDALQESSRTGERVGEALVRRGTLTAPERDALLEFQRHQRHEAPTDNRLRLGNILVSQGHISAKDLALALSRQRETGRLLGEQLVAEGRITHDVLGRALEAQRTLVAAALAAALAMAGLGAITPAAAAQSVTHRVNFAIKVPPIVRVQMTRQPAALHVTPEDIARGYVEVHSASEMRVTCNTTWELSFRPRTGLIRSARVSGMADDVIVGPEGGSRANLTATGQTRTYELSFRFELAAGAQPGNHPWPLTVSANAI